MSATLPVVGSQLMPYQLEQQLVPVHVLKMPKYGSLSEVLNSNNASRSDGGHELTVERTARRRVSDVNINRPIFLSFSYVLYMCDYV